MKAYTNINQSKKLAEILHADSADMKFPYFGDGQYGTIPYVGEPIEFSGGKDIPCWSLAALLSILPDKISLDNETYYLNCNKEKVVYLGHMTWDGQLSITSKANNIVDACYEMIIKLHKQNFL